MTARIRHNFRWAAWVMAFAVLAMAGQASTLWRCTDGRLCPFGGDMSRMRRVVAAPKAGGCAMCRTTVSRPAGTTVAAAAMQCYLNAPGHAVSTVQAPVHAPVLELAPVSLVQYVGLVADASWAPSPNANAPPEAPLTPHSGRAPPFVA